MNEADPDENTEDSLCNPRRRCYDERERVRNSSVGSIVTAGMLSVSRPKW